MSFYADITKIGRTSLTVKVVVYAERLTKMCNRVAKITEAELVFVALDENKCPIALEDARARFAEACPIDFTRAN